MNRRRFLAQSATLPFAGGTLLAGVAETSSAVTPSHTAKADAREAGRPDHDRYKLTLHRVLEGIEPAYTPEFLLADLRGEPERRFTEFSGDLSGRWIGALASCSASWGDRFPALDAFVARALPLQHTEGYFGKSFSAASPGDNDLALLWGNGRLLVGLMEYYALTHDRAALEAAGRLGDFLVSIGLHFNSREMAEAFGAGHFATSYICWTQQTEGLALLFAVTQERRYRDLCVTIAERIERRPGDHVHGYLSSLRGALMLHEVTHDPRMLELAVRGHEEVAGSGDVLITGGVPEAWTPKKKRTEGCAECDWLRLNLALHRATGEAHYLEMAEKVLFNEFAMNQSFTGDFGHGVLYDDFTPQTVPVRAWWCCTLHGLRAFADVNDAVFRRTGREIAYQLPLDGVHSEEGLRLGARSFLATEGRVEIQVEKVEPGRTLSIRKPGWASSVEVRKNGRPVAGLEMDSLSAGDRIDVRYGMALRTEAIPAPQGHKAIFYGPWLMGASSQDQPAYFNELFSLNQIRVESARPDKNGAQRAFGVPVAARKCDMVAAEFPDQPMQVELRPVAEQTGYEPARWQTAFVVKGV